MKQQILARVAALALLAGSTSVFADSVKVSDLPANVQKTVRAEAGSGKLGQVEKTTENGRTVYRVEVKREGQNKHLYVSEAGNVIRTSNAASTASNSDTHVEVGADKNGPLSKTDGKILGIIPAPGGDNEAKAEVKADADDDGVSFKADADIDRDKRSVRTQAEKDADRAKVREEAGVTIKRDPSLTSKTDGKILGIDIPGRDNRAEADVNVDTDGSGRSASVDVDVDRDRDLTAKNDGRILGVPKPEGSARADVDIDTDGSNKSVEADVDVDDDDKGILSKNDGKILGLPIPDGKKDTASVEADADFGKGASAEVDVDTDSDIIRKNDGKILGVQKPNGSARADVDIDTDDKSASVDVDADDNDSIFQKNDGKILGIPKPDGRDNSATADVDVDTDNDRGISGDVNVDVDRDRDLVQKNDGRILGVEKPDMNTRVEANTDIDLEDGRAEVEVKKKRTIFGKGDGKILGIFPAPSANKNRNVGGSANVETNRDRVNSEVRSQPQNRITTDADGGLDTDKNDGRILGAPKRGFDNLTINQVPAPVRRAIQREMGPAGKVVEIELETDDGQSVYEVDIQRDGKNRELSISPDGTVVQDD
ncbi:MAG: PepSY-like domain-containing protein [Verrucomicrobiales bacterium]